MSDLEVVPFFEESYIKMSIYDTANLVNDVFLKQKYFLMFFGCHIQL